MDGLGLFFNTLKNFLIHTSGNKSAAIQRIGGYPFLCWSDPIQSHFTYIALRHLHRRFGHPHVDRLYNFLKRANEQNVNANTREMLDCICRSCSPLQKYTQRPRLLEFTLLNDIVFKDTIYADIFYIVAEPIFQIVDEASRFQAATYLKDVSAEIL